MKYLIDVKTNKKLKGLPHIRSIYRKGEVPLDIDVLKIFFNKKDFSQKYISYDELLRLGLIIIERRIGEKKKMYKKQIYYYVLRYKKDSLPASAIRCNEIPKVNHKELRIRFDIFRGDRGAVRLEGRGTGYHHQGWKGKWRDVL